MAATLYFLLTLDFPRDEYADQSDVEAALWNPVVPIAERWAAAPGELARCIDRALSDDIRVRPRDATHLRNDMTRALGLSSLVPVRRPSLSQRRPEENRSFAAAAVLLIPSLHSPGIPRPGKPIGVEARETEGEEYEAYEYADIDLPADRHRVIAHLCVLSERLPPSMHVLPSNSTSIGRVGGGCDITIDDSFVSRWHVLLEGSIVGWQLRDLGSRDGGFIDGHRFGPGELMTLADGTVIRLGKTLMVFRASAPISDGRADSPVFPGISPVAVAQRRRIDALAAGSGHVLMLGDAGTGKVRVARAIGEYGAPRPFVTVNCTELSRDLARSELFGHVRGKDPDDTSEQPGLIDMVGDGVLFLDDIGELSLDAQGELLAFLENGSYRPLGSTEARHSKARVVAAATQADLVQAVIKRRLRRDLVVILRARNAPLELPPLSERREDILGWTRLFLRQGNRDPGLNPWKVDALETLLLYPWTKNLRELGPVVMEAAAQSPSFPLGAEHLPAEIRGHRETLRAGPRPMHYEPWLVHLKTRAARPEPTYTEIEEALRNTLGRVRMAAKQLGIDPRTLYQLCEGLGIALDAYRTGPSLEDE